MIEPVIDANDEPFLRAGEITVELLNEPAIAARWDEPSALPRLSIGALACHLGRQLVRADELLQQPTQERPLAGALEHYRRAAWVRATTLNDPANDRSLDDEEAAGGPIALRQRADDALAAVRRRLSAGPAAQVVWIPWQGWALRRNDFLFTRMLEVVVHSDDLAVSIGVATPHFPAEVFDPVLATLTTLAADRHGQSAVISALARVERAPRTISAF